MSQAKNKPEKRLRLEVRDGQELLSRFYPNGALGGLTLDGRPSSMLGERLLLTVTVAEPAPRHFDVVVQHAWVRHKGSTTLKESYGVDFDRDDAAARERLLEFANQRLSPDVARFDERVAADLPVKLLHEGKTRKETLADLSHGGAFVRTTTPLPVGAEIGITLRPPKALFSLELRGKVTWNRVQGEPAGMGISFLFRNAREEERLHKLLAQLRG
jgi:uncharacterized protein (TIGR02266 family)